MVQQYRRFLRRAASLLGSDVVGLIGISIGLGLAWFLIETLFLGVLQYFFLSLGLWTRDQVQLPEGLPVEVKYAVFFLISYGILRAFALALRQFFTGRISQRFIRIQRQKMMDLAINQAFRFNSHEVTSLFGDRIYQTGFVIQNIGQFLATFITLICFGGVALYIAPKELILGAALMICALIPFVRLGRRIASLGVDLANETTLVNRTLIQGLKNQFFIRLYGLGPSEVIRGQRHLQNYEDYYTKYLVVNSAKSSIPICVGLTVVGLITLVSRTYWDTNAVTLVSFFYLFMRLAQGASDLNTAMNDLRLHFPSLAILYRWNLFQKKYNRYESRALLQETASIHEVSRIEAGGLQFSYRPDLAPVVKNVNLNISRGQALLIRGQSGSGKSTLLSLLMGFLRPDAGRVHVNGLELRNVRRSFLSRLSYVGPEPYLIPGTIRQNLVFGHPTASAVTDSQLWNALELAALRTEIEGQPLGLDQPLLDAAQLSTGQKQRLSIARAFLREGDVVVFDEATANLDHRTEQQILGSLQRIKSRGLWIIVSHKTGFESFADQVLDLESK